MLLGATLAIGGGVVALIAVIALFVMLGDPMADLPASPRARIPVNSQRRSRF